MLNRLKKLFDSDPSDLPAPVKVDRIQAATCVILLEMAHADGEFHDMEAVLMDDLIQKKFGLPDEDRKELMEFAHREREKSRSLAVTEMPSGKSPDTRPRSRASGVNGGGPAS